MMAHAAEVADGVPPSLAEVDEAEQRLAEIVGVVHGGYGSLVALVADALERRLWEGWGIHSPAQWLAWKSGLSIRRAKVVVQIARRRRELPVAVGALIAGELSLDAVRVIVAHVPSRYDRAATDLARTLTVAQLERTLPRYHFGDDDDVGDDDDGEVDDGEPAVGPEEQRRASFWWDDDGHGHLSARLPTDEAMAVEAALRAARSDLVAARRKDGDRDGDAAATAGWIGDVEALVHLARSYLAVGRSVTPGADRYLIHAHLEQRPGAPPVLRDHLGPMVPDVLRRLVTCDADLRPVWGHEGVALSVGRSMRIVPDRARRIVEHRDGGCVVPGCGRRTGLDVHHIEHWEDGGRTDTLNLCCLCRRHHRQHHQGLLGITGDADGPAGVTVTDRWGRVLSRAPTPVALPPGRSPRVAARQRAVPAQTFRPPFGERFEGRWLSLTPDPARAGPAA